MPKESLAEKLPVRWEGAEIESLQQSSLRQSWADEMNDLAEIEDLQRSPLGQSWADEMNDLAESEQSQAGNLHYGPVSDNSPSNQTDIDTLHPSKQEQIHGGPAVTMPAEMHPVLQDAAEEGFAYARQQSGEPAVILDTEIECSVKGRDLTATPSSKNSPPSSGPSSSFQLQQSLDGQAQDTQSHFTDTPAHSQEPVAAFGVPVASQSPAEAQLEVTSKKPVVKDPQHRPEVTHEHQLDISPESRDVQKRVDERDHSSRTPRHSASTPRLATMDSSLWLHVVKVHPPPLDLSDSSSQLVQFERYIKTYIDPEVTRYIMTSTPICLPSFTSISTAPIMSMEVLKPLTLEYCQEFMYFLLRLEGIIKDLQGLRVEHLYWKLKRSRIVEDVKASQGWLRRKMEERIQGESEVLQKCQRELEDRILGSSEVGEEDQDRQRRDSENSNKTSSTMASATLRTVEGGVNVMFAQDDEEERGTFQRWENERNEAERLAATKPPQTLVECVSQKRQSVEESLERYIAAGDTPVAFLTPSKTPIRPSHPATPLRPTLRPETRTDRLKRVGWVGKETEQAPRRKVRFEDQKPMTPTPSSRAAPVSSVKGGFTGSPYQRTWTTTPAASKTDWEMDKDLQEDGDVFFETSAADTPTRGRRAPSTNIAAISSQKVPLRWRNDGLDDGVLCESTHPFIPKAPPKSPDARVQQFYATLAARGIRFGSVSPDTDAPAHVATRQRTLVAVPSRESLDGARARSLWTGPAEPSENLKEIEKTQKAGEEDDCETAEKGSKSVLEELHKNIRRTTKKIANTSKISAIMLQDPGMSLDELVVSQRINADQMVQILKVPALKTTLARLEEQLRQYDGLEDEIRK